MELFDMVKAAPPPRTISAPERTSTPSPMPPDSPDAIVITETDDEFNSPPLAKEKSEERSFKTPKNNKKSKPNENRFNDAKMEVDEEEDDSYDNFKPSKTSKKRSAKKKKTAGKSKYLKELEQTDSDGSSDGGYKKTLPAPTKTKAQQKMFNDLPNQSSSRNGAGKFSLREFRVRIRRLTQSEIDSASVSVAKSKFGTPGPRKRGRPRKSEDSQKSPSPAKKPKLSPPKVHIKVPLQSGGKKKPLANLVRTHTPPPILSSRLKPTPKPKPKPRSLPKGPKPSPAMIQRYGKRFFSCVVNVKNLKWPSKSPERKRSRPRRSNLSVSFNESVEILGSGSRRSTFGTISSKSPKPTRLQRVDATGNVLEDIALTTNMVLTGNSPSASSSRPSALRGKGKRRSCNGSPQLKRPHQRIPLSGLASLRLDDGPKSDDDDEEYIVPNELPGMQRPGTPTPRKKKISYTTTISDDEDDAAPPKRSKNVNASKKEPKTKPNQKKIEKTTSLKESVLQKAILQGKNNELEKEKEAKEAAVAETEVEKAEEATNAGKSDEESDPKRPEDNPKAAEEATLEADGGDREKSVEENGEELIENAEQTDEDMPALKEDSSQHKDDEEEQKDDREEQIHDEEEQKNDKEEQIDDKEEQKNDKEEQMDDKAEQIDDTEEKKDDEEEQEDDKEEQVDDKAEEKDNNEEQLDEKVEQKDNKEEEKDEAEETDDKTEQKDEPEEIDDKAEQKDDKEEQKEDKTEQKKDKAEQKDDKVEQKELEDVEDFRELDTPPSQPLPPTTEENPDDILEIQTSLEDVRQLHTPFSSQQTTLQVPKRNRRDSGDSDCSFKSAHEPNKDIILGLVSAEGNEAAGVEDATDAAAAGEDKSEIDTASMPAVLTTPPPSTPRTVNGCDPVRNDGSSIATVFYSPLDSMPTLDDEVLGQLVEPDFQLNSSRHAISRGTLDDIMTALES